MVPVPERNFQELMQQKASFWRLVSGYHSVMKRVFACLLGLLVAAPAARADEWWAVHRPNGDEPAFVFRMPDTMPETVVLPVGVYDAQQPPFTKPVARVDGVPIQRPLLPSMVADPVDRALVLRDYQKNGFMLQPFQLNEADKRQQHLQFHDLDAVRDLRLQKEHATLEDYRRYVAEEIKIATMLFVNSRNGFTPLQRDAMKKDYVARLHRKVVIEKLPA